MFNGALKVRAEDNFIFKKNLSYNIYFDSSDHTTAVLEHVEIIRFETIGGRIFMVIKTHDFDLRDTEGFILFDSVSAILPDRHFPVRSVSKIHRKIHY